MSDERAEESDETASHEFGPGGTIVALTEHANSPLHRWPSDFLESRIYGTSPRDGLTINESETAGDSEWSPVFRHDDQKACFSSHEQGSREVNEL